MSKQNPASRVLVLSGFLGATLLAAEPALQGKKVELTLTASTAQVVRGQTNQLRVFGSGPAPESVEITPPEGVSVGGIREAGPAESDINPTWAKKHQYWSADLQVAEDAALGERTAVFVTPLGRSEPQKIRVVTHRPRIADLKVVSANRRDRKIEIALSVFDEAEDLDPQPKVFRFLLCGYELSTGFATIKEFVPGEAKGGTIHATVTLMRPTAERSCELQLSVSDKNDHRSNELKAAVEWR
jgi:hypothetical protein